MASVASLPSPRPYPLLFRADCWMKLMHAGMIGHRKSREIAAIGFVKKFSNRVDHIWFPPQTCQSTHVEILDDTDDYHKEILRLTCDEGMIARVHIHTHPGFSPTPSATDNRSFDDAIRAALAQQDQPSTRYELILNPVKPEWTCRQFVAAFGLFTLQDPCPVEQVYEDFPTTPLNPSEWEAELEAAMAHGAAAFRGRLWTPDTDAEFAEYFGTGSVIPSYGSSVKEGAKGPPSGGVDPPSPRTLARRRRPVTSLLRSRPLTFEMDSEWLEDAPSHIQQYSLLDEDDLSPEEWRAYLDWRLESDCPLPLRWLQQLEEDDLAFVMNHASYTGCDLPDDPDFSDKEEPDDKSDLPHHWLGDARKHRLD